MDYLYAHIIAVYISLKVLHEPEGGLWPLGPFGPGRLVSNIYCSRLLCIIYPAAGSCVYYVSLEVRRKAAFVRVDNNVREDFLVQLTDALTGEQ